MLTIALCNYPTIRASKSVAVVNEWYPSSESRKDEGYKETCYLTLAVVQLKPKECKYEYISANPNSDQGLRLEKIFSQKSNRCTGNIPSSLHSNCGIRGLVDVNGQHLKTDHYSPAQSCYREIKIDSMGVRAVDLRRYD